VLSVIFFVPVVLWYSAVKEYALGMMDLLDLCTEAGEVCGVISFIFKVKNIIDDIEDECRLCGQAALWQLSFVIWYEDDVKEIWR
jgi:hypothetical protein